MSAASAKEKFQDGSFQDDGKSIPGSKAKKKSHSAEVTLPPLCPDPSGLSSARNLFSQSSLLKDLPTDRPPSAVEFPPLIAPGGPGGPGKGDAKRTKGQSLTDKDETVKVSTCKDKKRTTVRDEKVTRANKSPLTGTDVVQMFAQKRDPGDSQCFHLKQADGNAYRPYDLQVVHFRDAGPEHYIFSPNTVIHVTETGYGGVVSLAEWHRECTLWTSLQEITLFKDFRLRKAFSWWYRNVRKTSFQRKCKNLEKMLLIAVPQFRKALHLFTRVIEEVKATHWMPLDESKTYTLLEFNDVLKTNHQECLQVLQKLSQCHTLILNTVKEDSYKTHQELQLHLKFAQRPNRRSEPIHLHLDRQSNLRKQLNRSAGILQKLGNFAALIHRMIVQSVASIIQQDAVSFLSVLKRSDFQESLFYTELCFSENNHLILNPAVNLFQQTVSEALLGVNSSIVQMCEDCGFFLEISSSGFTSTQDLPSDSSWIQHPAPTGEVSSDWMTIERLKDSFQTVQGNMMHGCYYPLSKTRLEWQISTNDVTKQAEKVQVKTMQEAELEIQQLCVNFSWLVDVRLFVSEWSRASLESISGQPALIYEELIKKVRDWTDRINSADSSLSTSNQLFIVDLTSTKETLGRQLRSVEDEVLQQLVEQIKMHSENVSSDLEKASQELRTEPHDLRDFTKFALTVRESGTVLSDIQERMDYIQSLCSTVCTNYRKLTAQELSLEEKMLDLWSSFNSLFKRAEDLVCNRLSSASKELDTMFSFLVSDLKNIVSDATSGSFVDSNQNAAEMASKLNGMCEHLHTLRAKLEQLNTNSQELQEHTLDLSVLTADIQKVSARKELWELKAVYSIWLEEWKHQLFSEVMVSQDQGKISMWKKQAQSLINIIPVHDAVMHETLEVLESLNLQLELLAKLQSPTLKDKHWRDIFKDMGLLYDPEKKVTVADLVSRRFETHGELIYKICRDAQTECNMEQTFQKLCKGWEDRLFQLDLSTLNGLIPEKEEPTEDIVSNLPTASQNACKDSGLTVTGVEIHLFETENDLMTLSTILKSPHSADFRLQVEDWIQSLQELRNLLELFERYQQLWASLTKVFGDTSFGDQRMDLLKCFLPADEIFKEVMVSISTDPHVLNFDKTSSRFNGDSLCQILSDGLSTMETISNQMSDYLEDIRGQYLRLWFLSDVEVMKLLSFHPTPFTLQPFVCKCFKGVCRLDVDREIPSKTKDVNSCGALNTPESHRQMMVRGIFGSFNEHVAFQSPLKPNLDALDWLNVFEKQFKLTMMQQMKQCALVRNQLESSSQELPIATTVRAILLQCADRTKNVQLVLDLISKYPLQCLLVVEEAVWRHAVQQSFQQSNPVKLNNMKGNISAKLRNLGQAIRDGVSGCKSGSLVSRYTMMCRRALVQLTMNHAQRLSQLMELPCVLESSFEWLSLMKYHVNSEDNKGREDPSCYVEVLDHHFQYGFEYSGPEEWMMVHTPSTDQARLGTLLALANYKCGLLNGPSTSGKKKVVEQLGKALGRQVVIVQCYHSMKPGVVLQMLIGALQTGAWLLLHSVDLLTQNVLTFLGQQLVDIQQSFSKLRRNQRPNEEPEDKTDETVIGCTNMVNPECHMVLEGKSISASLNYGCVAVSSNGRPSKIPESLRFATRPVALMRPDYRIIAEVMLSSVGFSEAVSLSQRLVSLMSLAKDFHCLPDVFTDKSCFVGVLQKIICASELHLQQNVKQRAVSTEANAEKHLKTSQKTPVKLSDKDRKEPEKFSKLHSSHLSVVWSLLEETAVVKAVLSVLNPAHVNASQFYSLFRDAFPIASQFPLFQHYIEEVKKNQLQDAIAKELQQKQLHCDTNITCSAVTLYQTLQFSKAVMLIGPSGSGKTTCHRVLADALNTLAAKTEIYVCEKDRVIKGEADPHISASHWSFVDTLVLFPNSMTHEEMFGCFCEKTGWKDGVVAKVLRDEQRRERTSSESCRKKNKSDETQVVKWLIMDGEPVGKKPGWLDYLTTLCSSQDPFLSLSSGETFESQSHLKILMEMSDLQDANPSTVTRCSLVYFTGTDVWKSVWRSELDALAVKHKLSPEAVRMWNNLAEDLFSGTLSLIRQEVFKTEGESCKNSTYGLQEITSFVRILRALLQHFGKEVEKSDSMLQIDKKAEPLKGSDKPGTDPQIKQDQLTRNLFLVAYVWGFGGRLHSSHWLHFDALVRQVLFTCRYKIVVPDEQSVFDHFFSIDSRMCPKSTLLTKSILPKHEKYTHLLSLMLEANQPVLLAGDPGSGKTTVCKSLLTFDKPHINLRVSPLLSSRDLQVLLNSISSQKSCRDAAGSVRKHLLLFVDDLHEAPRDVFGEASTALETLRQSVSKGQILIFDTYQLKSLSSAAVSYMTTCCLSGLSDSHSSVISPRLSRLFSIFVLPSLSLEVIFSIHSPSLKMWLKELPLKHCGDDMSYCIIAATKHLFHAVCERFQTNEPTPHFIFSHHDLEKVFQGMCLWQSEDIQTMEDPPSDSPPVQSRRLASVLNIVHLWMHECMRTFSDRLCTEDERKTLVSLIAKTAATHYGAKLSDEDSLDGSAADSNLAMFTAGVNQPKHQSPDILNLLQAQKTPVQSEQKEDSTMTKPLQSDPVEPRILQHLEDIITGLVFGPDLSEALKSLNLQQKVSSSFSYKTQELDVLLQKLCAVLDRKDEDEGCNITAGYLVHRQRLGQLLHILRALLIPGGHGLLLASDGGTGRKTTVRLAAHLTGYQLIEVHSANEDKLHEILKQAGNKTREDGVKVVMLVHEDISRPVREEFLLAMDHKSYPPLYTEDELKNQISRVTNNSRKYVMDSWMFEKTLSQVHKNVHVFLLMPLIESRCNETPPNNEALHWTTQMSKAVRLSCCVEVYQPWSRQTLVEVAAQCLKTSRHQTAGGGSEFSLSVAMAGMHQSAHQYSSVLLTTQPFTPRTYLGFIVQFGFLFSHLHKECQSKANRLSTVLSHLDVLNNTAVQYKEILLRLQNMVSETQQHEKELLRAVDDQKIWLEEVWEKCVEEENKLSHLQEEITHAEKQEKPVVLSYLRILESLNPCDLEEVRHYRDPPEGVVKMMDAVCLLFDRPPGWDSAKQLLGQSNFFQELEFFERYDLTNDQLQRLGQIVNSPQFGPEFVGGSSKACESLCLWVQAVYEYCCVQKQLLVRQRLQVLAKDVHGQQRLAAQLRKEAFGCLEHAKIQQLFIQTHLEKLLQELHRAERTEREVSALAGRLEVLVTGWTAAAQEAELRSQNLQGDALILAAITSYLGPFGPDIRSELMSKWRTLCQTGSININPQDPRTSLFTDPDPRTSLFTDPDPRTSLFTDPDPRTSLFTDPDPRTSLFTDPDPRTSLFTDPDPRASLFTDFNPPPLINCSGFPIQVSERLQLPLSQAVGMNEWQLEDKLPTRLVVKLLLWASRGPHVQRRPLLTDTQQHFDIRCQKTTGENTEIHKETEFDMQLYADDPLLLDKLDFAADKGLKVLVTHMERATPTSEFLDKLVCLDECCFPGQQPPPQQVHPDFCLFLSTHLPLRRLVREIPASILTRVHVVDLRLSSEEIQELLLTQLLQSECKELLNQTVRLQNYNQLLRETLITEQDALMDYILQSDSMLLQDPGFPPRVAVCLDVTEKLQAEMDQLMEEQQHHESLLEVPLRLVNLAAGLYEALQAVAQLCPAYCFSLQGFINVMQEVFTVKERPSESYTIGKTPGSIIPEIMNLMVNQLLEQYRPRLFKNHAAVLKLLLSLVLLQHNQLCSEAEKLAFIRGFKDVKHPETKGKPSPLPGWIRPQVQSELLCLDRVPAFRGLVSSLCDSPLQWQEYLRVPSSTVIGSVPCRSHSHLSLLQRGLLWKTLLPNSLEGISDDFNACQLCMSGKPAGTEEPHTGNPEKLSGYIIKHEGPVILVLPDPDDQRISVQPLRLLQQMSRCVSEEVQVKVISFGGQSNRELTLSLLEQSRTEGHWLVFNNCHVLEQWDEQVVSHFGHLMSPVKEELRPVHPSFRLWFITQENASHLIPAPVRMHALVLVCESLWDLKEELSCSLQQVLSINQPPSQLHLSDDDMQLLLRCAVFHSVLLQRQNYKHLGNGQTYHWTQEDLLVLVDAYISTASRCHDRTKVLQDIAVNLVHGAHVMDSADLEVLQSVATTCFSSALPLVDSGPHIVSNIVTTSGLFDLSRLQQVLNRGLWDPTVLSDSALLGFSVDAAAELFSINSLNLNKLLQASYTPAGTERNLNTRRNQPAAFPSYIHARDRLQTLKSFLSQQNDSKATNSGAASPLRHFLQTEWEDLIDSVSSLLSQLRQPVQHDPTFASILKLADLSDLERRAELLAAYLWHHNTSDPAGSYRLAAFRKPTDFLVALRREAAKANRKPISDIRLHFQVLCDDVYPPTPPLDAAYLCGLQLKGALWDVQRGVLQETPSPQRCSLPLLHVTAKVKSKDAVLDPLSYESTDIKKSCSVSLPDVSPQLPVYRCPLYVSRDSDDWDLSDVNIITKVPLQTKLNPVLCSVRRVRLVSSL